MKFLTKYFQVDPDTREHLKSGGHWGHCKPNCPISSNEPKADPKETKERIAPGTEERLVPDDLPSTKRNKCQTIDGKDCIIPFKFNNFTRNGCITISDPENKPWCSLKVSKV